MFFKKKVLKNSAIFIGKHLCCKTELKTFFCEYYEFFKNSFFLQKTCSLYFSESLCDDKHQIFQSYVLPLGYVTKRTSQQIDLNLLRRDFNCPSSFIDFFFFCYLIISPFKEISKELYLQRVSGTLPVRMEILLTGLQLRVLVVNRYQEVLFFVNCPIHSISRLRYKVRV